MRAGGEIVIRDRNLPIARIVPLRDYSQIDAGLLHLEAQGKIRLGEGSIDDAFWKLPAPRVSPKVVRRAVNSERDED